MEVEEDALLFEVGPPASVGIRHRTQCGGGGGACGEQPLHQADFPLGNACQRIYLKDSIVCLRFRDF